MVLRQQFTISEFKNYLSNLPKEIEKQGSNINKELAIKFQSRVKQELKPVSPYSTGELKKSIKVSPNGKGRYIVTGKRYGLYLNQGIFPDYLPGPAAFEQHQTLPGSQLMFIPKGHPNFKYWMIGSNFSHANEGFINKAQDYMKSKSIEIIEKEIAKAFVK
jgi:hypothetical protein